jgi:SAM-dependent methyltransferase
MDIEDTDKKASDRLDDFLRRKRPEQAPFAPIISQADSLENVVNGSQTIDLFQDSWKQTDFDVTEYLKNQEGSVVEFAGPTLSGYEFIDASKMNDTVLISNISPGLPEYDPHTGELIQIKGSVDFQADATQMPLADESCKAILVSCLDKSFRQKTFQEAFRILKPGGLLVWQGGMSQDFSLAIEQGFEMKQFTHKYGDTKDEHSWNVIFAKT